MKNPISFDELHRMVTSGDIDLPVHLLRHLRATMQQVARLSQATNVFLADYQKKNGSASIEVLAQALIQVAAAHLMVGLGMDAENFGQFARTVAKVVEPTASKAHGKLIAEFDQTVPVRHCICADCFARRHPDKRTLSPEERGRFDEDLCCFCGKPTRDGINEAALIGEAAHCGRRDRARVGSAS